MSYEHRWNRVNEVYLEAALDEIKNLQTRRQTMKTSTEVSEDFKRELQLLLDKYGAELEASDHWTGYAECGKDIKMVATIPAIYDDNHDCTREWTEVDLGNFMAPSKTPVFDITADAERKIKKILNQYVEKKQPKRFSLRIEDVSFLGDKNARVKWVNEVKIIAED